MNRTLFQTLTLCLCLFVSASLMAQLQARTPRPAANPEHPLVSLADIDNNAVTTAPFNGTLVFNFTITVKSSFPAGTTVYCRAGASIFDSGTGREFSESATAAASGSSGSITCTAKIPYHWLLATSSSGTDTINLDYEILAVDTVSGVA